MRGDFARRSDSGASARRRTITFANGDTYDGEAPQGQPDGIGTYTWASGDKYVGSFGAEVSFWGAIISVGGRTVRLTTSRFTRRTLPEDMPREGFNLFDRAIPPEAYASSRGAILQSC
jgi:hypothetical protein